MEQYHRRREGWKAWASRPGIVKRKERRRQPRLEGLESRQLLTTTINDSSWVLSGNAGPQGITAGPNGQIWFANTLANQVQSLTTNGTGGGTPNSPIAVGRAPEGIVYVPGGDIWFTETGSSAIGRIDPANGQYTQFVTPTAASQPLGITYDPANGLVYFTEAGPGKIGFFNPATITSKSDIQEKALPNAGGSPTPIPNGIVYNPGDQALWFVEQGANQIGMFDPATQSFNSTPYNLPNTSANPRPTAIALGSDGNLWFNEYATAQVEMFNPATRAFAANGPFSMPADAIAYNPTGPIEGITAGPDGDIYFTVGGKGQIGWFNPAALTPSSNPSQAMTVVKTAQSASPWGITAGPDGNVWFSEYTGGAQSNGAIGVADLATHLSVTSPPPTSVAAGSAFSLTVKVTYDTGAVDAAFNGPVTVSLASGPAGGSLGGVTQVSAVNGVATFKDLTLGGSGSGYSLVVSGGGMTAYAPGTINVTPGQSGGGGSGGGGGNQPGNSSGSTTTAPTIIAEQIGAVYQKFNKKHKPIGKPVEGIVLTFSTAMNDASIRNAGNYQVSWASTRKVKRKLQTTLHPIGVLSATPNSGDTTVALVTSAMASKFAKGGQLKIVSPGSILSAANASLGAPTVFVISPRAAGISPSS